MGTKAKKSKIKNQNQTKNCFIPKVQNKDGSFVLCESCLESCKNSSTVVLNQFYCRNYKKNI